MTVTVNERDSDRLHGEPARTQPVDAITATAAPSNARRAVARAARVAGRVVWKSAAILLFLLFWEFGPNLLLDKGTRVFLPPLHEDLQAGWHLLQTGELQADLHASIVRAGIGFAVALAIAIPLGILIAWYRHLASFLTPLLELFRNTAALALLPVFVLLLGIGETSKITIVGYAAFFPILLNTIAGVRTVDPLLVRAARSLGLSSTRLFIKVVLPSAVPTIFTGIRMAGSASILVLIAAEMVGAKAGLGFLVVNAQNSFLIPDMYAGILATAILGAVVNFLLVLLERHFSRWRTGVAVAR
jgi:NitT/TauT family transport system permease protein